METIFNYYLNLNFLGYGKSRDERFYYLSLLKEDTPDGWSIHGFWPQYSKNKYPTYCKKIDFDITKLNPIIDDLNNYWYSSQEKNELFWKHEWEKHGSCMFNDFTEFKYFNTTLILFKRALELKLPEKFYNKETNKCLIPLNLDLEFISIN